MQLKNKIISLMMIGIFIGFSVRVNAMVGSAFDQMPQELKDETQEKIGNATQAVVEGSGAVAQKAREIIEEVTGKTPKASENFEALKLKSDGTSEMVSPEELNRDLGLFGKQPTSEETVLVEETLKSTTEQFKFNEDPISTEIKSTNVKTEEKTVDLLKKEADLGSQEQETEEKIEKKLEDNKEKVNTNLSNNNQADWAKNIKSFVIENGEDGIVAYAIYNGIDACIRLGTLVLAAVSDDQTKKSEFQLLDSQGKVMLSFDSPELSRMASGESFVNSTIGVEHVKVLVSFVSAKVARKFLGESALSVSVKESGPVTMLVLATLVGNQLIIHGDSIAKKVSHYPKTALLAGASVGALAYWCKDGMSTWIENCKKAESGNKTVLFCAVGVAALSIGVTIASWAYNKYITEENN